MNKTPAQSYSHWVTNAPPVPALCIAASAHERALQREWIRTTAWTLLGDFPDRSVPRPLTSVTVERRDGYRIERFSFDDGCGWQVPGVVYIPDGPGPFPAVLWCHWHGGDYALGLGAVERAVYTPEAPGPALVLRGYVVLAIEAPGFGSRNGGGPDGTQDANGESSIAKHGLLFGRSMWGLTVHDDLCALAVLAALPEVDPARIGTAGISMGCLRALWLAALDERLKATVAICCLVRWQDMIAAGGLMRHGHYSYVPGLLRHFDVEALLAAIAPRALLSLNGELDLLVPLSGIHTAERLSRPAWELAHAGDRLRIEIEAGAAHAWTPTMWRESLAWLDQHRAG